MSGVDPVRPWLHLVRGNAPRYLFSSLLSLSLSLFPLSATQQTADRPTLDCAMQQQTCSPAALSIPLRYLDFVIILIIIEHDSGKAVCGHRRQASLLRPLFIGQDKRKTTKNDTAHAPDREGNEMFILRRRGKTLTLESRVRHYGSRK